MNKLEVPKQPRPVFLLSAQRSGSTWLMRMLQTHGSICGGEESRFFSFFGHAISTARGLRDGRPSVGPLTYISDSEYMDLFRSMWDKIFARIYESSSSPLIHLEKTPENCFHVDAITEIFPDAKFIAMVRDSRAVSASLAAAAKSWGKTWAPSTVKGGAIQWWRYNSRLRNSLMCMDESRYIMVRYEDIVRDVHGEIERIANFLNIDPAGFSFGKEVDQRAIIANDPSGFFRRRGVEGWVADLTFWQKIVVWRYTRKLMRELGYACGPFDRRTVLNGKKDL